MYLQQFFQFLVFFSFFSVFFLKKITARIRFLSEKNKMVTPIYKNIPSLPLNDGFDLPQVGLISFRRDPEEKLRSLLLQNLDNGIRHIEVCDLFDNGQVIIDILLDGGAELRREKLYLTLKIWSKNRNYENIINSLKEILISYSLEYFDLILIHGPLDVTNRIEQYKAIEELKQEGLVHSIGLSNMTHTQLSNILKKCNICPAVIEVTLYYYYYYYCCSSSSSSFYYC